MIAFTCRREQSLVIADAIRILVLQTGREGVRFGIDAPVPVSICRDEAWSPTETKRRDLVCWHADPRKLLGMLQRHFPDAADDVAIVRSGLAYFGHDPATYSQMTAFIAGATAGESRETTDEGPER